MALLVRLLHIAPVPETDCELAFFLSSTSFTLSRLLYATKTTLEEKKHVIIAADIEMIPPPCHNPGDKCEHGDAHGPWLT